MTKLAHAANDENRHFEGVLALDAGENNDGDDADMARFSLYLGLWLHKCMSVGGLYAPTEPTHRFSRSFAGSTRTRKSNPLSGRIITQCVAIAANGVRRRLGAAFWRGLYPPRQLGQS